MIPREDYAAYAEAEIAKAALLRGRRILVATPEVAYGRTTAVRLLLDDHTSVRISWWGSYADDGGLEFDVEAGS